MAETGPDVDLRDLTVALLSGAVQELARKPLDDPAYRERCVRYWRQQRVVPPLARIVARDPGIPQEWQLWARSATTANAVLSLQHMDRIGTLVKLFREEASIEAMPLKGVVLSLLLYGDPGFRHCGDIDLLVPQDRFDEALELLLTHGYEKFFLGDFTASGRMKSSYRRFRHEVALRHPAGGPSVEIHHRVNNLRGILPDRFDEVRASAAAVQAGRLTLHTPGPDHLLAFLAVHAMFSRWSAMKWLYDLPMVIERFGDSAVENAYRQAHASGFTPLLDVALALGARLTGREAPACRGYTSRQALLVDAVWRRLGDGTYAAENRLDTVQLGIFRMRLLEGYRARWGLLTHILPTLALKR